MAAIQNDVYRSSLIMEANGQLIMNVLHWRILLSLGSDTAVLAHLNSVNNRLIQLITNTYAPNSGSGLTFVSVDTTWVAGDGDPHFLISPVGGTGSVAADLMPTFVSVPIYFLTGLAGRSNRGRIHVAGLTETDFTDGELNSIGQGFMNDMAIDLAGFRAMLAGIQSQFIVWSRTKWLAAGGPALSNTDPGFISAARAITTVEASGSPGTMYSRKVGRGS